MKNQTLIMLIIAGACGLVVMLGVKQYLDKQSQKEEVPTVSALVAIANIRPGEPFSAMEVELKTVEVGSAPETAVASLEDIKDRSLKVARGPGDWILMEHLNEPGEFGVIIPQGMRVATIDVDANQNHSGMLRPGNRIDVMLTYDAKDPDTRERVRRVAPVLQFVEVFAVGNKKYGVDQSVEDAKARNISLLVTIEQWAKLEMAKQKGKISTALRNMNDKEELGVAQFSEDDLFNGNSEINTTSARDMQEAFNLPEEPDESQGIFDSLKQVVDNGSAKDQTTTEPSENTWIMAIHEGGIVRVEHIDLTSTAPIDTRGAVVAGPDPSQPVPPRGGGAGMPEPPPEASGMDLEEIQESLEELLQ